MASISSGWCVSFILEALSKQHDLENDSIKMALIKDGYAGVYNHAITNYSDLTANSDEVSGTGYTAGGLALTGLDVVNDGNITIFDFDNPVWAGATFNAAGALIYNASVSNAALAVLEFKSVLSPVAGTLTLNMPDPTAQASALRLSV